MWFQFYKPKSVITFYFVWLANQQITLLYSEYRLKTTEHGSTVGIVQSVFLVMAMPDAFPERRDDDIPFGSNDGQVQLDIMRQQDEQLDELALAVNRIGDMGKEINQELESQSHLLDDLDDNFSSTRARMGDVHSRLNAFIQETSRGQLCTIAWLSLLFLVLLFLLITTT